MKKFINNQKIKIAEKIVKTGEILKNQRGEAYLDLVIKCLLCIVLGALLLSGLYRLFDSVVMPRLETEIVNMFDYDGN